LLAAAATFAMVPTVSAENLVDTYKRDGVRVGLAGYAPYGYKQPDGTFTGEQAEVARHTLEALGISNIEFVVMDFGALIPALVADRIDLAAAGIYVRPERCEQVLFAEPTFGQGAAYVVKAGNPKNLHTFKDIAATEGATLAVLAGGTEETLALKDGVPDGKLLRVSDKSAGIGAVMSGRADGFALSAFAIADIVLTAGEMLGLESSGSITEIAGEVYKGHGALAFRKGQGEELASNQAFVDQFNVEQAKYLAKGGGYAEMAARWGFAPSDGPVKTTAELCSAGL
jgi:polar amino acid transport system substrate-binding protein